MAKALQKSRTRRATGFSAAYKARCRVRVAKMAKEGRGGQALNEVAGLLGIDLARGDQLRLTRVRSLRIR
jgi:hypothetical protein